MTLKSNQVPEEVWKALRREIEGSGLRHWPDIVVAILNVWPGMEYTVSGWDGFKFNVHRIILPLPQEGE